MQAKIDANWPGTKLSITEYENGGSGHIAGSIAQADNLGIFGSKGLFAANFWPASTYELTPFVAAAFKMYRDYDGQLGSFGDISMAAASSDTSKVATYVSQDSSHPNRYIMVAINRSTDSQDVNFAGLPVTGTVKAYRIEGTQTTPVFVGEVPVDLASWVITLPTLSVTTIELTAASALTHLETWRQQKFGISTNTGSAADTATPAHDGIQNLMKYALNLEPGVASSSGYSNSIVMDISTGFLRMTVTRNPSASDVSFTVEVSGDVSKPTDWTANGTTVDQNTSTTLQVHDNTPITGGLRRFMRLKVTHP